MNNREKIIEQVQCYFDKNSAIDNTKFIEELINKITGNLTCGNVDDLEKAKKGTYRLLLDIGLGHIFN